LIKQNRKCVWKDSACIEEPVKACSEINFYNCECYGSNCFIPENRKKECYPVNNECKEVYMDWKIMWEIMPVNVNQLMFII
jgi:hypothetical protein